MIRKEHGVEPAFVSQFRQSPVIADVIDIVPVSAPVFPGIGEVSGGVDADIEIEPAFVRAHAATFSFWVCWIAGLHIRRNCGEA